MIFEISSNASELNEFIQVFGQRFVGLIDNGGVYYGYRVPDPEAPYPQDYIIDQQGIVRYWSDEYDPQEIIRIIDALLAIGVEEQESGSITTFKLKLSVSPNPARKTVNISVYGFDGGADVEIFDLVGRSVFTETVSGPGSIVWHAEVPNGTYSVRLESAGQETTETLTIVD